MTHNTKVARTHDVARQLQWVAWLQSLGLHLHPCDHPALPRCAGLHTTTPCDGTRGKHPAGRWTKIATNDPDQLRVLFARGPRNIGVACGPSRLLVVDEDRPGAFAEYAASIGEAIPRTLTVTTAKGRHFYFRQPEGGELGNATGRLAGRGIDIRGRGGYVIGPGSRHETGVVYTPIDPAAPILPAPAWLIEALQTRPETELPLSTPQGQPIHRSYTSELARALARDTGDRSADFAAVVGACKRAGLTPDETVSLLINARHPAVEKYGARLAAEVDRFWWKASEGRERLTLSGHRSREGQPTTKPLETGTSKDEGCGKGRGPTQADILLKLAAERYTLGRTPSGEPFAVAKGGPYIARMLRGGQRSLRAELAAAFHAATGRAASSSALADALLAIEGQAQAAPATELYLRTAPDGEGGILIDLGREDGAVAHITPGRWEIVHPRSGPLFRRTEVTGPLPDPERGGDVELLRGLVNVTDEHWPLLLGWLLAAYVPDIPHPVALLVGEQGTAKTTTGRMLVGLVDPSTAPLRAMPRDEQSWAVAAAASWVVGIDNVSYISPWLSDAMCRAVTGEALVSRRLYTDTDLSVLQFRRVLLLTSIDTGSLRGDLADRMLTIELHPIPDHQRRTDRQVAQGYAAAQPKILGGLFDLAAEMLAALPGARKRLTVRPRMADFAEILAALDEVTGTNALKTYLDARDQIAADLIEGDPVAAAVRDIARERGGWKGEVAQLFEEVDARAPVVRPRWWPKSPGVFSGYLNRAAPALRKIGVEIERKRIKGKRVIELVIKGDAPTPGSVTPDPKSVTPEGGDRHPIVTPSVASRPAQGGGWGDDGDALNPLSSVGEKKKRGVVGHKERRGGKSVTLVTLATPNHSGDAPARNGRPAKGCSRWIGAEGRFCAATEGLRRYPAGLLCPEHQPRGVA
ncbi:MAG: hypothetical protein DIU79_02430 [Actinobacteria bacterium]|nr:MAG: hypothetical protein DIU79_02430 [Actinomycetota bacterium]